MFQAFKDKAIEKIKNLAPLDDLDREITSLVEQGTAPDLIAPNWGVCMALCDLVNLRSTEDPQWVITQGPDQGNTTTEPGFCPLGARKQLQHSQARHRALERG